MSETNSLTAVICPVSLMAMEPKLLSSGVTTHTRLSEPGRRLKLVLMKCTEPPLVRSWNAAWTCLPEAAALIACGREPTFEEQMSAEKSRLAVSAVL